MSYFSNIQYEQHKKILDSIILSLARSKFNKLRLLSYQQQKLYSSLKQQQATYYCMPFQSSTSDITKVRQELINKYQQLCKKINHQPNHSLVRNFSNPVQKSFYLDIVYRGNDKLNFNNRLTDRDIILLTSALQSYENIVRHIDLSYNQLTDVGIEIFSKFLEQCTNIQSLNVQGNKLGALSAQKISAALSSAESVKYINFENNQIGTNGVISITKNLLFSNNQQKGRSLEQLNIGNNGIDIDGVICITSVLNWNNNSLRILNIDNPTYKSIGQQSAIHYAKMLQVNRGIEKLSMRKNQFTCQAIYTIKQLMLQNNRLKVLDLSVNKIASKGCEAIHDILTSKYCVLQSLNISSNRIGHYGAKALSQALSKNRTLIHLDMTKNQIDDNGLKMVAQSLETNENLVSLKLYFNDFGQLSLRQFHKLYKRKQKIPQFWDFTTYIVDNEIQMAYVQNNIKYDVNVSRKYYC